MTRFGIQWGSAATASELVPATQAATDRAIAAAAPVVTAPASAPVAPAIRLDASSLSAAISTGCVIARRSAVVIANATSSGLFEPPSADICPAALMIRGSGNSAINRLRDNSLREATGLAVAIGRIPVFVDQPVASLACRLRQS